LSTLTRRDIFNCCKFAENVCSLQLAVVRQVLRKEIGLKIVEVDTDKAHVEGSDVLWTGETHFYESYLVGQ